MHIQNPASREPLSEHVPSPEQNIDRIESGDDKRNQELRAKRVPLSDDFVMPAIRSLYGNRRFIERKERLDFRNPDLASRYESFCTHMESVRLFEKWKERNYIDERKDTKVVFHPNGQSIVDA